MEKVKIIMVGNCPNCGEEFVRKPPVDAAACTCKNPDAVLVPLSPALLLPSRIYKKWSKIAELAEIDVEVLINKVLEEGAKQKLKELEPFPSIIVTVKGNGR